MSLLLLLLVLVPVLAQAQFTYTNNNGTLTITGYTGPGGDVTIPDEMNGLPVTGIGDWAFAHCSNLTAVRFGANITTLGGWVFYSCTNLTTVWFRSTLPRIEYGMFAYCSSLTSISIPNSVTNVNYSAFLGCTSLTNIMIPDAVTSVGDWAFEECTSLTNVWLPASLNYIGSGAFNECSSLLAVGVDAASRHYSSFDGVLFDRGRATLLKYPAGKGKSYTIPNSVTRIGGYAFAYSYGLTNVIIPNSVVQLWAHAFSFCTSLTSVTLPNSVTSIGYAAFADCKSLSSISIPDSVTSIERWALGNCPALTNVAIPRGVTYIGSSAFDNCPNLAAITVDPLNGAYCSADGILFDKSVTTIVRYPEAKAGTVYEIPNTVTTIEYGAFYFCTRLNAVVVPGSLAAIKDMAFYLCTHLWGLYFEGNAPTVGVNTFAPPSPTVYYLPGASGWGSTFAGARTALWPPPVIQTPPRTQTAEVGATVELRVTVPDPLPALSLWYFNDTNFVACTANCALEMTNAQLSHSGTYNVIVTNAAGSVTSAPAVLNVIPAVARRPAAGVTLLGEPGTVWNVDYANAVGNTMTWLALSPVTLTSSPQYCFDASEPLPPARCYRAWQTGAAVPPTLGLRIIPALTVTGNIDSSIRVDYINRFGPIDAWVTLDTVTLTNTSQLYFDVSAPGQPERLYRLVPSP